MASRLPSPTIVTSTLLVTNIHCPSCVSYATDVLSTFSDVIQKVDTSVLDHTIRIRHAGDVSRQLANHLVKAAFEVEHVTVTDDKGNILQDFEMHHADASPSFAFLEPFFVSKAQRTHIKNCNACQEQRRKRRASSRTWVDVIRRRLVGRQETGSDVESGLLRLSSQGTADSALQRMNEDKVEVRVADFSIEGMTCASCVSTISNELRRNNYIESVDINLVANSARVTFRGTDTTASDIRDLIEDVGYGAEVEEIRSVPQGPSVPSICKASLSVEGMTCGSCVGTVTRGLKELSFLHSVNVDLVSNSAVVEFETKDNLGVILEKIEDLGYDANVVSLEEVGPINPVSEAQKRSVTVEIDGMYCPKCPSNILDAIDRAFPQSVIVTKAPTLSQPRLVISYHPSVPTLTIRRILEVVDDVDPACSASIYHAPSLEERSRRIQRKERNRVLRHLLLTFLIAIPSFIVGIVYMDLVPDTNATRQWFEEPIWAGNAMRIDWALFIMTTPAMFYGASIFHVRALKEIWTLWRPKSQVPISRRFYRFGSMNLLISAGTSVAYFASIAILAMDATTPRQDMGTGRKSSTYFDTVTFLTFFILVGRFLEAYSKAKTGDAVSMLANLRPKTALLLESNRSGRGDRDVTVTRQISVDLLELGDLVSIPHGACPPTDGVVAQEGAFLFDESSLTGESRPVKKTRGDKVLTGSVNAGDPVHVTVTEIGGKSILDQIVNVVREGQAKRAPIERLADTLTGFFTPVITLLAIVTWIIWLALGESGVLPQPWLDVNKGGWAFWSVEFAIAVFVVACPCGIGLAAPTALFVGGGLAAQSGILVQGGGEAFQEASNLDTIVFDKTGTLTEGKMKVTEVELLKGRDQDCERQIALAIAKALEDSSTHPIAKAIVQYCEKEADGEDSPCVKAITMKEVPGQGMYGGFEVQHRSLTRKFDAVIGNERLLKDATEIDEQTLETEKVSKQPKSMIANIFLASILNRFQSQGNTTAILAIRQKGETEKTVDFTPTAVFAITDPLREEAPSVLSALRSQGLQIHMCTGDNLQTAQSIASQVSIPPSNIRAGVLPQDKAKYIEELQRSSETGSRKVVAFVGDGTNDTPALTVADVSIALSHPEGGGSDIALTSSSFVLLNSNLTSILTLVKLSKRVFFRVKLNFMWAAIYNVCLVPVAAGVFFPVGATYGQNAHGGFRLSPVWASVAMAGSSVSVVFSSLALRLPELSVRLDALGRRGSR